EIDSVGDKSTAHKKRCICGHSDTSVIDIGRRGIGEDRHELLCFEVARRDALVEQSSQDAHDEHLAFLRQRQYVAAIRASDNHVANTLPNAEVEPIARYKVADFAALKAGAFI